MKTTFPKDPARALRKAEILIELEANVSDQTFIGYGIQQSLKREGPKDHILDDLRAQAAEHYWRIADVVGYKLLDKIIAFK